MATILGKIKLPKDCVVIGEKTVSENNFFRETIFFVKGTHPELFYLGRVAVVNGLTGTETRVAIRDGPSEYFYG